VLQEIESNSPKCRLPSSSHPAIIFVTLPAAVRAAKMTHETHATAVDGCGYGPARVAARWPGLSRHRHRAERYLWPLAGLAKNFPAIMHMRLYGMNANGKVYTWTRLSG